MARLSKPLAFRGKIAVANILISARCHKRGAILQCRGDFPADARVDWLFDKSGGRGAAPPSWPKAREGAFCGYAGGLNPDNIGVALPAIAACVPEGQPYWIDMESGVRTDDRFDLDKCELVLTQVFDAG